MNWQDVKKQWFFTFVFIFIATFLLSIFAIGEEFQPPVAKVDKRIELLTIVFRLAGAEEFQSQSVPRYTDEIDRHFAPFRDHKAIKYVREVLRRTGIGQNAVVNFGIHLTIDEGKVIFPDPSEKDLLRHLDPRWHLKLASRFAALLDDFYTTTGFHQFFEEHRVFYQSMEQRFADISDSVDYSWFKDFYATDYPGRFHIILMPACDDGGFGAWCASQDSLAKPADQQRYVDNIYAFIGTEMTNQEGEPFYDKQIHAYLMVHEFNHSWCNPIVDKHFPQYEDEIASIFAGVAKQMGSIAYGKPKIMTYEYFVRLADMDYAQKHFEDPAFARQLQMRYRMLGFVHFDDLVPLLDQYAKNRDIYPTFDCFAPEIIQTLIDAEDSKPKIVEMVPPNHSTDVDPSLTCIHVTFDRPMSSGMAWCSSDLYPIFPLIVNPNPSWSEDGKTCTLAEISLKPNTTYNIWLNLGEHQSFQSVDEIPLPDTFYTFTTGSAKTEAEE